MGIPLRVLMIEDSEDDAALLERELRRGDYDVHLERVDEPSALEAAFQKQSWDLIISDFSMPHFSGTDALKLLRSKGCDKPFIFVSGTIGEETAVAALRDGAQDYLMKSNLKRLIPAVQRVPREAEERQNKKRMELQVQQLQKFEAIGKLAGGIAISAQQCLSRRRSGLSYRHGPHALRVLPFRADAGVKSGRTVSAPRQPPYIP